MGRVFVDTAFLVAIFNPKDNLHDRALSCVQTVANRKMVTTDFVLLEFGNRLAKYGCNLRSTAAKEMRRMRNDPNIEVVPASRVLFEKALDIYEQHGDKDWGIVDCSSFVVMSDRGLSEALTNDGHFRQMGFTALLRED